MKQLIILSACIALAIAMVGCNSDDRSKYERRPVPEDLKQAFLFNEGTYWIYASAPSETVDSVYIVRGDAEWIYNDDTRMVWEHINQVAEIVRIAGTVGPNTLKYKGASLVGSTFGGGYPWPLGSNLLIPFFRLPTVTYQGNAFIDVGLLIEGGDSVVLKEKIGVIRYRKKVDGAGGDKIYELVRWNISQ